MAADGRAPFARRRRPGHTASRTQLRRVLPIIAVCLFCAYAFWFSQRAVSAHPGPAIEADALGHVPGEHVTVQTQESANLFKATRDSQLVQSALASVPFAAPVACTDDVKPHMAGGQATCGDFSGSAYVDIQTSSEPLERAEMTISAWVLFDEPIGDEILSIQTIVSNKHSGCSADPGHDGFSVFVNAWNTNSRQLYLSWGNSESGCEELATENDAIPVARWTFIAATFDGTDASLYVNGKLLAHTGRNLGHTRTASGSSSPVRRSMKPTAPLRVGAHADAKHHLRGYVAELSLHASAMSAQQVSALHRCGVAAVGFPVLRLSFVPTGPLLEANGLSRSISLLPDVARAARPLVELSKKAAKRPHRALGGSASEVEAPAEGSSSRSFASSSSRGGEAPAADWPLQWLRLPPPPNVSAAAAAQCDADAAVRLEHVRGAFKRAWSAYRTYAWGADEVKPVSNRSHNWLRLGATLVDCLDNLWLFDMKEEFAEAQEWVATKLELNRASGISMFETVIRILGGLLSAFELSAEPVFLRKAQEVADHMMYAFDANPGTGLPCTTISFSSHKSCSFASWSGHAAVLAEYGTIQLEFKYLAQKTGLRKFWDVAERPMLLLRSLPKPHGLYPTFINPQTGRWSSEKFTFGALADSFYEYLIKQWLITNKKETYLREMFDDAMIGMAKLLVQRSSPSQLVYIADWSGTGLHHKMDHLACFAGAMLAIGAQDGHKFDKEYMALALALGDTCYEMYARTATGLSPEYVSFVRGKDMQTPRGASYNIGRPEAVETFFVLWYYTRDPKWRDIGWEVFRAFEKHAATGSGWAGVPDVDHPSRKKDDKMESFVLAETMKYLFLLFDNDYPVPLEKYVINTEAHPLGRFEPIGAKP